MKNINRKSFFRKLALGISGIFGASGIMNASTEQKKGFGKDIFVFQYSDKGFSLIKEISDAKARCWYNAKEAGFSEEELDKLICCMISPIKGSGDKLGNFIKCFCARLSDKDILKNLDVIFKDKLKDRKLFSEYNILDKLFFITNFSYDYNTNQNIYAYAFGKRRDSDLLGGLHSYIYFKTYRTQ